MAKLRIKYNVLIPLTILSLSLLIIGFAIDEQRVDKRVSNHAEIKTVNVTLHDINGTEITSIDWGLVEPNKTESYITYVTSDSNLPIIITSEYLNWTPPAMANFTTMWSSLDGLELQPTETKELTFFMFIEPSLYDYEPRISTFDFLMVVIGSELERGN